MKLGDTTAGQAPEVKPDATPTVATATTTAPAPEVDTASLKPGTPEYDAAMAKLGQQSRTEVATETPPTTEGAKSTAESVPPKFLNSDGSVNTANFMKSFVALGGDVTKVVKDGAIDVQALTAEYTAAERSKSGKKEETKSELQPVGPIGDGEDALVKAAEAASQEFYSKGQLSDETVKAFTDKGIPKALIDSYVQMAKAASTAADITAKAEQREVLESVGGQAEFERINAWATANLSQDELDALNAQIATSKAAAVVALKGLKAMAGIQASAPKLLTGAPSSIATDIFASKAEFQAAMQDARYGSNEAYRQQVYAKLARSKAAGTC